MVAPGLSEPFSSASSIIATATRSFTLPVGLNDSILEAFTGTKKEEIDNYEYKDLCSPLKLINKSFPPVFLIYAEKDIFCAGQAELLSAKLTEKDIYFEKR